MQLDLPLGASQEPAAGRQAKGAAHPAVPFLRLSAKVLPLQFVHNPRARRYILRLLRDGTARVTVPRRGSMAEARRFAESNIPWLERQVARVVPASPVTWRIGDVILFRGEPTRIDRGEPNGRAQVRLGPELIPVNDPEADLRPEIQLHLWQLACREFPPRVLQCAVAHQLPLRRVSVRNQRSRWGSCSRKGCVSLNWRLIQTPEFVRDYIIWHELAHLAHMNHSARFWAQVQTFCPDYTLAESWLKANSRHLNFRV